VTRNEDPSTVAGFGREWAAYDQTTLSAEERQSIYDSYFRIFPWDRLPTDPVGADIGCGSGRWAAVVAPRVGELHLVDASEEALSVARKALDGVENVTFHHGSVGALSFDDAGFDFAYSLGVLHHVPDTRAALAEVARTLKPGAPFLVYLYYRFDNRPAWFRRLWAFSDGLRRLVMRLPFPLRRFTSDVLAALVYWPLARAAWLLDRLGRLPESWPLRVYRDRSFYSMRTDSLDRFGTRLEQRFTRDEVAAMLDAAGFRDLAFSDEEPYWCAVGFRR
jgi:ubiquinone/menaquinone biosynthesis C-methylase UbiE